jgi:hypothetical protein
MSIFTASRGDHCSHRTSFSRGEGVLETAVINQAEEEMVSNDMCIVYAMPRSQTLDEVLADKELVRSVYNTIKLYTKTSIDMRITIMNEWGYKLRLASFASMLRELVNNDKDLEGSTVVADVT